MKMRALILAAVALPTAVQAAGTTQTGTIKGVSYTATQSIVGTTSTATQAPPTPPGTVGNPIYLANNPKYTGVAQLVMHEAAGDFLCTGSLLGNSSTIVTAGHCVSSGNGVITASSVDVYFNNHLVDTINYLDPNSVKISSSSIKVNPLYTGAVIDDHDIAVISLATAAPDFANVYQMYAGNDLTGLDYNTAGFGRRSDQGGSVGADLGAGRIRQGDNRYDFRFGDPVFGGAFDGSATDPNAFSIGETSYSWIADFDNGLTANDASCKLAAAFGVPSTSTQFCNLGRGPTEALTAPGDSGGPQFVNGQIATVTSYGLSFGTKYGDIDSTLNDSFGEFNGLVSLQYNADFLASAVPEPGVWTMLILGFGAIGRRLRVRRASTGAAEARRRSASAA